MLVQCPTCAKQLQVPDSAAGKKAKCPGCAKVFEITAPTAVAAAPPKAPPPMPRDSEDEDRPRRRPRADEDDDEDDDRPRGKRRRDEDDDDDLPRSKRGRDEDDDDAPRSRRKGRTDDDDEDDDYDDRPRRLKVSGKSGAVTAVGIINIVLGSLVTLGGICFLLSGLIFTGAAVDARNQFGPQGGGGLFAAAGAMIVVLAILVLLLGAAEIMAGVGVLNRRPWGRILTLVLAGLVALSALGSLWGMIQTFGLPAGFPGKTTSILTQLVSALLEIGYVVMAFTVLLNQRYASEFR